MTLGVVIIGRNEGERLIACLKSVLGSGAQVVYVDSGSTDASVEAATNLGATVVALDLATPFTAARARNAGLDRLLQSGGVDFVQFVDGDCEIVPGWIETAQKFLTEHPKAAAACGRRRERSPEASIYNNLCDSEWDTPIGPADACGGDVMMRIEALRAVSGYDGTLIAGEEPELCLRLREKNWEIHRLDAEMTLHDLNMTNLSQYWRRTMRAGHAFAEVSNMHAKSPKRIWARETMRAIFWSSIAPAAILSGLFIHPVLFAGLFAYPLQIARLAMREGGSKTAWTHASLLVFGKFAEAQGVLKYWVGRITRKRGQLIEYKA